MAQGSIGFGEAPEGYGPSGQDIPRPIGTPEEQFTDDIHEIKRKYVDGSTNLRVVLQLAANARQRQDMTGQRVNSIILTVTAGVIFGYLFDVTSGSGGATPIPDFSVSAGIVPTTVQIMVPERTDYIVSWQEGAGAAATGCARILKI